MDNLSAVPLPRALLVTRNFPPLIGGMERVNQHLLAELSREWRVSLCGPGGCAPFASVAEKVCETALRPVARFLVLTAWKAIVLARKQRPGLIVAGSGLAVPMAWLAAKAVGARLVVYLHGLDIIAPSLVYQSLWLPLIRRCDVVLVNSENTGALARNRGIPPERISVLHPGTDIPSQDRSRGENFRARFGLGARPVLLSVGRLTRRKGIAEFITYALPAIARQRKDVLLLIIGEEASDALHAHRGSELVRVAAAIKGAAMEQHVRIIGHCDEATLGDAYEAADCHAFPVLDLVGDVEGFGMVALESAAHGLWTVGFMVGGVGDAIAEDVSGHKVSSGDYVGLAAKIISLLGRPASDLEASRRSSRLFAAQFEWKLFGQRLLELVQTPSPTDRGPMTADAHVQSKAHQ